MSHDNHVTYSSFILKSEKFGKFVQREIGWLGMSVRSDHHLKGSGTHLIM